MSNSLDVEKLRRRLESRFSLNISRGIETIEGGEFTVFRLGRYERGEGFGIVLSRSARQVEATFLADNFARKLLRDMSESDEAARATFMSVKQQAIKHGMLVYAGVNGNSVDNLPDSADEWLKVDLDVTLRLLTAQKPEDDDFNRALAVCSSCFSMVLSLITSELESDAFIAEPGLPEGARMRIEVNRYERSPANRAACITHFGCSCQACGFDFLDRYGEFGEGFIEVHHITPVSQMGGSYVIDPVQDLIPLCSNCHSMIHRTNPPLSLEKLREILIFRPEA